MEEKGAGKTKKQGHAVSMYPVKEQGGVEFNIMSHYATSSIVECAARLYEQEPERSTEDSSRFRAYVNRWFSWLTGGLSTDPTKFYDWVMPCSFSGRKGLMGSGYFVFVFLHLTPAIPVKPVPMSRRTVGSGTPTGSGTSV